MGLSVSLIVAVVFMVAALVIPETLFPGGLSGIRDPGKERRFYADG